MFVNTGALSPAVACCVAGPACRSPPFGWIVAGKWAAEVAAEDSARVELNSAWRVS